MFDTLRIGQKAKESKKFTPVHPDDEIGTSHGISLMLCGKHSTEYRNTIAKMIKRTKGKTLNTDESIRESARLIVDCCDDWKGVTDEAGKAVKYDKDKLTAYLIDDDFRWMRLQAETFMQTDDNFFETRRLK
jgi:hypothetical protein